MVGAWSDITARKHVGEALVAAQNRLVHVLVSSPSVIYSFKASGDFAPTFISDNVKDLLGYEPNDYLENPDFWRRCVHPDDLAGVEAQFEHLFKKGSPRRRIPLPKERRRSIAGSMTNGTSSATRTANPSKWSARGATSRRNESRDWPCSRSSSV